MLEFRSVNKVYRHKGKETRALNDVSFDVTEGEVFGFVGPNGAGKSTTIKVLLDVIRDYQGDVRIFGKSARDASSRQHVAYLPESPVLYEQFTPLEILTMALSMYGIKRTDKKKWCQHWLEKFSISQYANQRINQLSKGNVQRVALAHAMVVQPKLLVLDEPLSGLDPVGRKDVTEILQQYKATGGAIFFTSHVLHDVERIADRFGFINEGKLLTTQSPRDLMQEHADKFVVRYQSDTVRDGSQLREDEYEHEMGQNELPAWLEQINRQGGRIISISPLVSLERVFFSIIKDTKAHENRTQI